MTIPPAGRPRAPDARSPLTPRGSDRDQRQRQQQDDRPAGDEGPLQPQALPTLHDDGARVFEVVAQEQPVTVVEPVAGGRRHRADDLHDPAVLGHELEQRARPGRLDGTRPGAV
ncbi:hypothetical protein O1L55_30695 [Streptomyces albulus]|nr:hypothetical protein [Streptomyces noursei]